MEPSIGFFIYLGVVCVIFGMAMGFVLGRITAKNTHITKYIPVDSTSGEMVTGGAIKMQKTMKFPSGESVTITTGTGSAGGGGFTGTAVPEAKPSVDSNKPEEPPKSLHQALSNYPCL